MALFKADQRRPQRQKAIRHELHELRARLRRIDRAWSDTRRAMKQYEWAHKHVVQQLRERQAQLLDEMRPLLRQIDTQEKKARRLDRTYKAQQASAHTPAGLAGSSTRTPSGR